MYTFNKFRAYSLFHIKYSVSQKLILSKLFWCHLSNKYSYKAFDTLHIWCQTLQHIWVPLIGVFGDNNNIYYIYWSLTIWVKLILKLTNCCLNGNSYRLNSLLDYWNVQNNNGWHDCNLSRYQKIGTFPNLLQSVVFLNHLELNDIQLVALILLHYVLLIP